MKSLIGKEYSFGTNERYATAWNHTKEFIEYKYNVSDYPIKQVNHEFFTVNEYFLKVVRKCSHNTAIKYLTNFKNIMYINLG